MVASASVVKPGYTTTEFWVTVVGNAAAIATNVFHKQLGINVDEVATAGAFLGNMVYAYLRTKHKTAVLTK